MAGDAALQSTGLPSVGGGSAVDQWRQPMQWLTSGVIGVVAMLALSANQPVTGQGPQPSPLAQRFTPSPVAAQSGAQAATSVPSSTALPPGGLPGGPVTTPSQVAGTPVGAGATATPVATST